GNTGDVTCVEFHPHTGELTSTAWGRLRVWQPASGRLVKDLELGAHAQAIAFSPDGRLLANTHPGNAVRLWGAGLGQLLAEPRSPATAYPWTVAFSPEGRYLAAGGDSGLALWELGVKAAEGKLDVTLRPVPVPDAPLASGWKPSHLVFSRDGERLAWVQTGVH